MALLAALALRQRLGRRPNQGQGGGGGLDERLAADAPSAGGEHRASACDHGDGCSHEPEARAFSDFLRNTMFAAAKLPAVDPAAGNGLGSESWSRLCSSERLLFAFLLVVRFGNCLLTQTSYVPDEYWQSVEVAHHAAFGYGYLTWEWREKIRSFLYPAVFALLFKAAGVLGIDTRTAVVLLPRLMQSVLAAIGDLCLYRMSRRLSGPAVAQCALLCQLLSWYTFYTCTRTLVNSTEVALTTIALSYYPFTVKEARSSGTWKFLWLAALTCLLRPTAAVIWMPLCMSHIWVCRRDQKWSVFTLYLLTTVFFVLLSLRIDKSFYGEWVFTPYKFVEFNVLSKLSSFYGVHPWHWYFTQGLPVLLGPHVVLFLAVLLDRRLAQLNAIVVYVALVFSLLPHKEFRFISPVLPIVMHVCGYWITARHQRANGQTGSAVASNVQTDSAVASNMQPLLACSSASSDDAAAGPRSLPGGRDTNSAVDRRAKDRVNVISGADVSPAGTPTQPSLPRSGVHAAAAQRSLLTTRGIFIALAVTNLPLMAYFSLLHQRGGLDAMAHLHEEHMRRPNVSMSVLFLMPCHSTPFYSHLHANVSMRFLTCEPPLPRRDASQPLPQPAEEAEEFYKQPLKWLKSNVLHGGGGGSSSGSAPSHLVMYDVLQPTVAAFITKGRYALSGRFFHTHFPSGRMSRDVLVYRREVSVGNTSRPTPDDQSTASKEAKVALPTFAA